MPSHVVEPEGISTTPTAPSDQDVKPDHDERYDLARTDGWKVNTRVKSSHGNLLRMDAVDDRRQGTA